MFVLSVCMFDRIWSIDAYRFVMVIGASLFFGSILAAMVLTPTVTVQEVSYQGVEGEASDSAVYMSSLSEVEQTAVREGQAVGSLEKYTKRGFSPNNQFGTVVGDKGVYSIHATADYGVWHLFVMYGYSVGMGFVLLGMVLLLFRSSSDTSVSESVE